MTVPFWATEGDRQGRKGRRRSIWVTARDLRFVSLPEILMAYLNCPLCHLSIEQRSGRPVLDKCPRCRVRRGSVQPLFRSRLPWRELAIHAEEIGDASVAPRRLASPPQGLA